MNDTFCENPSVCIDLKKHRLRIHKKTLSMLKNPKYIEILVNPKKKCFIVRAASDSKNAHHIMFDQLPKDKQYYELNSRTFINEIQNICNNLESFSSYRIIGHLNSDKNAACFSLDKAIVTSYGKDTTLYA